MRGKAYEGLVFRLLIIKDGCGNEQSDEAEDFYIDDEEACVHIKGTVVSRVGDVEGKQDGLQPGQSKAENLNEKVEYDEGLAEERSAEAGV